MAFADELSVCLSILRSWRLKSSIKVFITQRSDQHASPIPLIHARTSLLLNK